MTRELKLALIVGFALVLTVAILVSDHLSKARSATLASLGGNGTTQKVVARVPDSPIRSLDDLIPASLPAAVEVATPAVATTGGVEVAPMDTGMPMSAPVVIGQQQVGGLHDSQFGAGAPGSLSASIRQQAEFTSASPTPSLAVTPVGATPQDILQAEIKKSESEKAAPLAGEKTYKVADGDSLYAIAKKFYSDGTQWKRLVAANPGKVTDKGGVKVGTTIVIPGVEAGALSKVDSKIATKAAPISTAKAASKPESKVAKVEESASKSYQVRPGDTLTAIARKQLGSASRAGDIAAMNKMDPDDDLLAGAILKIPSR